LNLLCWPSLASLLVASSTEQKSTVPPLSAKPLVGQHILDIACGNGLTSRRLAARGAQVTAFDFSANLIERARARENPNSLIDYRVIDATNEKQLLSLGERVFDSALCNMALFDMADIETLFRLLPRRLKPNGTFVFSLMHPAFNNASSVHVVEEMDYEGEIQTVYSVKISRYMSQYHAKGLALRGQPKPQMYFQRPLHNYFNLGFQNGFVLDGYEERAFPPDHPQTSPLGWGGKFSEIPPVLVARFKLM
jgi:SAM-dependent methyltransferase